MSDEDGRYFISKRPGWIYGSPRFPSGARILDEIVDTDTEPRFAKVGEEVVIRQPPAGRFQIKATIWEDDRRIETLTIQKWRVKDGYPHDREHFSFVGKEIPRLLEFVQRLRDLHFDGARAFKTAIDDLRPVLMSPEQEKRFLAERQDLVIEAATNDVTRQDIIALAYRRGQLVRFERLLTDDEFFAAECQSTGKGEEGLWQAFFEKNPWVLGHGLSYAFMTELDDRKLEQVVKGFDVAGPGKRADGLLKTHAHLSSLAFVEIKKHTAELVQKRPYRPGVWPLGADLVGGVAQCHAVVHAAGQALGERLRPNDEWGDSTGEDLLSVHPRCFLIIGRLSEFGVGATLNMSKFRSFESFRRNTHQPEILTYDELLYRARHIVDTQAAAASADPDGLKDEIDF